MPTRFLLRPNNHFDIFRQRSALFYCKSVRPFWSLIEAIYVHESNGNLLIVVEAFFFFCCFCRMFPSLVVSDSPWCTSGPPKTDLCVSLLPPSCVADMGGIIRAIRQTDRWQLTGATVRVKSQKEKSLFFSSSLAYWPSSSSFSVPLLLVPVSSLHVTRQNTFAEQAKHPIPPRQEATVKFNRVHLKEEEIEKKWKEKKQIELNQTDEKIWKFSNQIRTNFFLLFKNFYFFKTPDFSFSISPCRSSLK